MHRIMGANVPRRRNELNSIPALIDSLQASPLSEAQKPEFSAVGRSTRTTPRRPRPSRTLKGRFDLFCGIHSRSLDRLKEVRDKIGAHSDSKANITDLPSHAEFETLYSFAYDFYALVSDSVTGFGRATFQRSGPGCVRLAKPLGAEGVKSTSKTSDRRTLAHEEVTLRT